MKPLICLTYSVIIKGIINNYFFILLVKNFLRATKNDFWASRCWLQLAQRVKLISFAPWSGFSKYFCLFADYWKLH